MKTTLAAIMAIGLYTVAGSSFAQGLEDSHKTLICHKGETISIAKSAIIAHALHGDTAGSCEAESEENMLTLVMVRCGDPTGSGTIEVVATAGPAAVNPLIEVPPDANCAETLQYLLHHGFELLTDNGGGNGTDFQTEFVLKAEVPVGESPAP